MRTIVAVHGSRLQNLKKRTNLAVHLYPYLKIRINSVVHEFLLPNFKIRRKFQSNFIPGRKEFKNLFSRDRKKISKKDFGKRFWKKIFFFFREKIICKRNLFSFSKKIPSSGEKITEKRMLRRPLTFAHALWSRW